MGVECHHDAPRCVAVAMAARTAVPGAAGRGDPPGLPPRTASGSRRAYRPAAARYPDVTAPKRETLNTYVRRPPESVARTVTASSFSKASVRCLPSGLVRT